MNIRSITLGFAFFAITNLPAAADSLDPVLLVGSWKLTAIDDELSDGRRRETWGSNPQGILQFTSNGIVSVQIIGGDRGPQPGSVPTDPVGPLSSYYGTYTVDAVGGSVEFRVQRSSWPQWNGAVLKRMIMQLSATTLKVVSAQIDDPKTGAFTPHLEWERMK